VFKLKYGGLTNLKEREGEREGEGEEERETEEEREREVVSYFAVTVFVIFF
jgi:hypothetical protein